MIAGWFFCGQLQPLHREMRMSLIDLFAIATGLSMDAFTVAVVCSLALSKVSARQVFRFAFHFGFFQAMMPILGWLSGRSIQQYIEAWDHWIAFGLLVFVGGRIIYKSFVENPENFRQEDPTRGLMLITLSVATSIDALAVGLSLAMIQVVIWYPALIIGLVTLSFTTVGMFLGSYIGQHLSRYIEIAGGAILISIGIKILILHDVFAFILK